MAAGVVIGLHTEAYGSSTTLDVLQNILSSFSGSGRVRDEAEAHGLGPQESQRDLDLQRRRRRHEREVPCAAGLAEVFSVSSAVSFLGLRAPNRGLLAAGKTVGDFLGRFENLLRTGEECFLGALRLHLPL